MKFFMRLHDFASGSSYFGDYPEEVKYSPQEVNWKIFQTIIIAVAITVTITFCLCCLIHYLVNRRKHNVIFGDYQSVIVKHNTIVPLPLPEKEGYTFGGWYRDEELTDRWRPMDLVTADTYLFPKWKEGTLDETQEVDDCEEGTLRNSGRR